MTILALIALAIVPVQDVARDRVDLVEVNHFFDDQGRKVFDQAIFYDFCTATERFQVRAWRLVKDQSQLPERDWEHGGYAILWQDGETVREVRAAMVRETWTQVDVELLEREILPQNKRKGLSAPCQKR